MLRKHTPIQTELANGAGPVLLTFDYKRAPFSKLEFLVREATQNALDASRDHAVKVYYDLHQFRGDQVMEQLEGFESRKLRGEALSLEIRDYGKGLDGPLNNIDETALGAYVALVARIGQNLAGQQQHTEAAGGSFGHGKTLFYHFGVGLVFFYTRLPPSEEHPQGQERLGACFVRNKTTPQKLRDALGELHYWGEITQGERSGVQVPFHHAVTDQQRIHATLKALNVTPFTEDEHGTSVIIPWFNLDQDVIEETSRFNELDELSEHFKLSLWRALYRFYTTRVYRSEEDFQVMGERRREVRGFTRTYFDQLAKLSQRAQGVLSQQDSPGVSHDNIYTTWCTGTRSNQTFNLGVLALKVVEANSIRGWESSFPVVNVEGAESRKLLIAYSRAFGMNVNFWTEANFKLPPLDLKPDERLLGFFMLDDQGVLPTHSVFADYGYQVGRLFRFYENNMHISWDTGKTTNEYQPYSELKSSIQAYLSEQFCRHTLVRSSRSRFNPASRLVMEKLFPNGFATGRGNREGGGGRRDGGGGSTATFKGCVYQDSAGHLISVSWLKDKQPLPCKLLVNPSVLGLGSLSTWEFAADSFPMELVGVYVSSAEPTEKSLKALKPLTRQQLDYTVEYVKKQGIILKLTALKETQTTSPCFISVDFKSSTPGLTPGVSKIERLKPSVEGEGNAATGDTTTTTEPKGGA